MKSHPKLASREAGRDTFRDMLGALHSRSNPIPQVPEVHFHVNPHPHKAVHSCWCITHVLYMSVSDGDGGRNCHIGGDWVEPDDRRTGVAGGDREMVTGFLAAQMSCYYGAFIHTSLRSCETSSLANSVTIALMESLTETNYSLCIVCLARASVCLCAWHFYVSMGLVWLIWARQMVADSAAWSYIFIRSCRTRHVHFSRVLGWKSGLIAAIRI